VKEPAAPSEDRAVATAVASLRVATTDPVAARLSLLRAGGNRATARLLSQRLQRVGGWTGSGVAAANQAESTNSSVRRIPVEGLAPVARALVLLPPGLNPARNIDVLVHLHGQNAGYKDAAPRDLNANLDRIEEQLGGAGRPQLVIVLPQGSTTGADYGEFGQINPRAYALAALNQVHALGGLASAPAIGAVMLSGHSGGGFAMKTILDDRSRRADLSGVVWFDAVQAEMDTPTGRAIIGQREKAKALIVERITAELDAVPAGATPPEIETALRTGFTFRLYYDAAGGYGGAAREVAAYLRELFGESGTPAPAVAALAGRIAALPGPARSALRLRYQVVPVPRAGAGGRAAGAMETIGHDNMVGSGALADAIAAMPAGSAPAPTPPATTSPPATGPRAKGLDAERSERERLPDGTLLRTPARTLARQTPPEDVPNRLIEATVALGHADGDPPGGRTLLRRDDIRDSLTGRASNAALNGAFDASVRQISALTGPARDQAVAANASGLILMLEDAFIQDPGRSGIDLLPPARASHFRGMRWHRLDYPGHAEGEAAGPNEGEAEALSAEMARLRPERRPNQGANNVVTRDEMTPARWRRINANLETVEGQGRHRLFGEAAHAFHRMSEMARYDNVELQIFDSFRPQAVAAANAAQSGNPMAVASFSSHSLGLAVDLNMSVAGGQQFQEATTRPMSNVAGMRASPVYKWMLLRGAEFGWFPYGNEPWHWEYNPDGFRARFRALVMEAPAPAAAR
jgi:hypothetical protein